MSNSDQGDELERDDDQAGAILPFDDGSGENGGTGAGRLIRRQWHDDGSGARWWFSVVDVVAVLTDSLDPNAYWRKLKQRLTAEGSEVVTNCHGLKMRALDGKLRSTDAADTETMLRIVQSIPSPKAEPFKQWLAREGARRLAEVAGELPEDQRRLMEHALLAETTARLERSAKMAGVITAADVAIFHDEGYRGLYEETAEQIAVRKDVPANEITEWMGSDELSYNLFRATLADQQIHRDQPRTRADANEIHYDVGQAVRQFIIEQGATLPERLPTPAQSIPQLERAEYQRLQAERREAGWPLEGDVE